MSVEIRSRAVLLCGWVALGALGPVASAGVSVSPLKQEVTARPGETVRFKLTVSNNARGERDTSQTVRLELVDVAASRDGALAFPPRGSQDHSAGAWISPVSGELTLEPGESRAVEYSLSVPHSAAGEYYSAVMVTLASPGRTETGVAVTYRIASGVFVTVPGRSFPREAKICAAEVVWPQPPESAGQPSTQPVRPEPAKVAVVLQNTGRARFDASGKVSVLDERSRVVFAAPLTSRRPCVFGGDSRQFEAPLDRPLEAGRYVVRVEMDYQSGWNKAHRRLPLDITPEQAELLKAIRQASRQGNAPLVEPLPEKLSLAVPAGAFRAARLAVKSHADADLRCTVRLVPEGDRPVDGSWLSLEPAEFELSRSAHRTLGVVVRVPPQAAPGRYTGTVVMEAGQAKADSLHLRVPLELQVQAEK